MAGVHTLRLTANCFLRAGAGPAAAPLGVGKRGAVLAAAGEKKDGWIAVEWRGGVAWVAGRFAEGE